MKTFIFYYGDYRIAVQYVESKDLYQDQDVSIVIYQGGFGGGDVTNELLINDRELWADIMELAVEKIKEKKK